MKTEEKIRLANKAIDRKFWEYFEKGEREKIATELFASNFKLHFPGRVEPLNISESKETMKEFNEAFPDLSFTIEEQIAEGDLVVSRITARGTHKGEFKGIFPTNKSVRFTGTTINRIAGGKIIERWTEIDALGLMTQLGVPEPEVTYYN